jgi:glycerol kinase
VGHAAASILNNKCGSRCAREGLINTGTDDGLFLVIDQGGHASRVAVFDRRGVQLANAVQPVAVHQPRAAWVEQDADEIVLSVRDALMDVGAQLGSACQYLRAAGLATQRSNIVCWDRESGAALSAAISWQDRRARGWIQPFENQLPQIRAITGLRPSAHYGASKIRWCLDHLPEVQSAHDKGTLTCGPLASFLLFRLLKEKPLVVDAVNASRTLFWDWRQRNWSDELLNLFGLVGDYLPQGVANRYSFGQLEIAGHSIPLSVCTGDQSAALFAGGKPQTGVAYINIGTGAFLQCVAPATKPATENPAQQNLLRSVVWDDGNDSIQVLEATVNGAGSALLAVANGLGFSVDDVQGEYAHWLATAKNIPLYLNGISGLGSPFWQPQFVSQFVGPYADDAQPSEKMVAVLESIVFLLCLNLQEMSRAGVSLQHITISGGLSVLDGLCQRLADISQLPVERAPQTEATAKGLAYLLASPEQAWLNEGEVNHFVPQNNSALSQRYQQWHSALLAAVNDDQKVLL